MRNNGKDVVIRFSSDNKKPVKKPRKLKRQNLAKSQKLAKSEKKSSKSGNLSNFDVEENKSSFLTPKARAAFN